MKSTYIFLLISCLLTNAALCNKTKNYKCDCTQQLEHKSSLQNIFVVSWEYHKFSTHITLMVFIIIVILFQMIYHKMHLFAEIVPESLLLIIIGVMFGAFLKFGLAKEFNRTVWRLTPDLFFYYLLPPIILESSYNLHNRTFGEYLGSILLYAIVGTIFNFFLIGFGMFGLHKVGAMGGLDYQLGLKGYLLFASLIVAVDPVAVLAIFQDIGVDYSLYYMVFGESLLNDAVTIVLYEIMEKFVGENAISSGQIVLGVMSFFTIALGGLMLGILCGVITCLITRFKANTNFVVVLVMGYFSYIIADTVGWSGLISMIGCGLIQAAYAFHNLSSASETVVRQVTKQVAGLSEAIIFLYLGIELFVEKLEWQTGFMLWSIILCLVSRTIVVFLLSFLINWVRVDTSKIKLKEQLIMIYGGLRGAVAFSLATVIDKKSFANNGAKIKNLFITATLWVILITVGLMGMTMKPMVKLLNIKMAAKKELSLFSTLNNRIIDYNLAAIETIINQKGRNRLRDFFMNIDDKYIRKILQREPKTYDQKIVEVYEKVALKIHYATVQPAQSSMHLCDLPKTLQMKHLNSSVSLSRIGQASMSNEFEPGYLYEIMENGQIIKSHRKPSDTDYDSIDYSHISQLLRSTTRISAAANQQNRESFSLKLRDILKSKGLVIRRLSQINHGRRGRENLAYSKEEDSSQSLSCQMPHFTIGEPPKEDNIRGILYTNRDGIELSRH